MSRPSRPQKFWSAGEVQGEVGTRRPEHVETNLNGYNMLIN